MEHGTSIGVEVGHRVLGLADLLSGAQAGQSIVESVFVTRHFGLHCHENIERLLTGDWMFQAVEHGQDCCVDAADRSLATVFVVTNRFAEGIDGRRTSRRHRDLAHRVVLFDTQALELEVVLAQAGAQRQLNIGPRHMRIVQHDMIHQRVVFDRLGLAVDGCSEGGRRFGVRHESIIL